MTEVRQAPTLPTLPTLVGEACSDLWALLELRRQTFDKAPRYGLDECIDLALTDEHPLAVLCYHICSFGSARLPWITLQVLAVELLVGFSGLEYIHHVMAGLFVGDVLRYVEAFLGHPGVHVSFS